MKSSITHRFIKHIAAGALIFYVFSGVSSLLNYGFYPLLARFVTVSEYGEIQFLVSMFTQLAVGFVVLNILAIIIGARLRDHAEQETAIRSLNIIAGIVTLVIVIIGGVVLISLIDNLNLTSLGALIALCLSLLVNVPFTIAIGRLQGNDRFVASGIVSMLGALLKLLLSLLFVVMGGGVMGAILGIFAGMAMSLAVIALINKSSVNQLKTTPKKLTRHHIAQLAFIKNQATVALLAVTVITLLSAADSITSRIVLSGDQAGHYASVATVAKMILAATSPLMWLALPPAIKQNHKLIAKYILVALVVAVSASVCFNVAPVFFTNTIIGVDALQYVGLLPLATVGMSLCAIAFIVLTSAICIGHLKRALFTTLAVVATYFVTISVVTSTGGALMAALYGQITASAIIIALLLPSIVRKTRSTEQQLLV